MARTTTAVRSRSRRSSPSAPEPGAVGIELGGVALCLGAALMAAALLTLAPAEASGGFRNVTGGIGRMLAGGLTGSVGLGAWAVPIVCVAWGIQLLRGRKPERMLRKGLLIPLLMALTAVEGALLFDSGILPGLEQSGPGGFFGVAMGAVVYDAFGKSAGLVVAVCWLMTFRLITEIDLMRMLWNGVSSWLPGSDATAVKSAPKKKAKPRKKPVQEEAEEEEDWDESEEMEYDEEEWEDDEGEYEDGEWEEEDGEDYGEASYEEDEEEWEEDDEGEWEEDEVVAAKDKKKDKKKKKKRKGPPPRVEALIPKPKTRKQLPKRPSHQGEVYKAPPLDLLQPGKTADPDEVRVDVERNAEVLEETLASFGVEARVVSHLRGPAITFFEIKVPSGIRLSRVTALADDLAIALKASAVRIVAPIPGRSTVGIEVPNGTRDVVCMRDLLEEESEDLDRAAIPIVLGRDGAGRSIVEDLASAPHLLIAGATGSGKSVCINSILLSVLYTRGPGEVNLILVDPKQVELAFFEGIPHLLTPVVTDMRRAAKILEWAVERMEERYTWLLSCGVRNIASFNNLSDERRDKGRERAGLSVEELPNRMPYLVIVIDELADVMLTNGKEVELSITRLAQKSRAVGIHLVLATQRPSTNVITGLIKANMPTRIAFVVSSKIDSRVILDANGADRLLGHGDMLYMHPRSLHLRRAQGSLVTDTEARETVDYLKEHYPVREYEDILKVNKGELGDPMKEDDLFDDAVRAVLSSGLGSASMLQRRMGIGYTRASRLVDMMCDHGIVGPHVGSKAREVLMDLEDWEATIEAKNQAAALPSDHWDDDDPPPVDTNWD